MSSILFTAEGIATRADAEAGYRAYRARRQDWESKLRRLSLHLGYDWDEVTGDGDLHDAADEERVEPENALTGDGEG